MAIVSNYLGIITSVSYQLVLIVPKLHNEAKIKKVGLQSRDEFGVCETTLALPQLFFLSTVSTLSLLD